MLDLGSVSTGYSDKPVAMAIKIKHAGFNLTGQNKWRCQFRMILRNILNWKNKKSHKPQAASLTAGDGYCRMNLERIYYGQ